MLGYTSTAIPACITVSFSTFCAKSEIQFRRSIIFALFLTLIVINTDIDRDVLFAIQLRQMEGKVIWHSPSHWNPIQQLPPVNLEALGELRLRLPYVKRAEIKLRKANTSNLLWPNNLEELKVFESSDTHELTTLIESIPSRLSISSLDLQYTSANDNTVLAILSNPLFRDLIEINMSQFTDHTKRCSKIESTGKTEFH